MATLPPLTPEVCAPISMWIETTPPERQWVFRNLVPAGTVGMLQASGGVGKSHLANLMAVSAAMGYPFGAFFPSERAIRTLVLNVEDPENELRIRLHWLAKIHGFAPDDLKKLSENLFLFSGVGKIGPLMRKSDSGKRERTEWLEWLEKGIEAIDPEFIILDTKARLYGLEENDNTDNTLWLNAIEQVAFGRTCLVVHHTGKGEEARTNLTASGGRGASSGEFNSRFVLAAAELSKRDTKAWFIDGKPGDYIKMALVKGNYSKLSATYFFKRMDEGVLYPVRFDPREDMQAGLVIGKWVWDRIEDMKDPVQEGKLLRASTPEGEAIRKELAEEMGLKKPGKNTIQKGIERAIQAGWVVRKEDRSGGGRPPVVLTTGERRVDA